MLKTQSLFRLGVALVALLFVLFFIVIAWPQNPPKAEEIAQRGLKAPPGSERIKTTTDHKSTTIGAPRDWIDQALDSLSQWDNNPLGFHHNAFGQHLWDLKQSKDPKDQEEYQRLLALAKKWQDNLLTRYPELKIQYRDVADDKNALKCLYDLQARFRLADGRYGPELPDSLKQQLSNKQPWDAAAAQAWVDANRAYLDELRAISKMPESSIQGFYFETLSMDGASALMMDARLAADRGDYAASLESLKAVRDITGILKSTEAPPLIHLFVASAMQRQLRNYVLQSIMPTIPASAVDIATWESVLRPEVQTPADFANSIKGEWNYSTQHYFLPTLADPAETQTPSDAELLVETYTQYMSETMSQNESLTLTELPTTPNLELNTSGLSWRSRKFAEYGFNYPYRNAWQRRQMDAGLTQAAFAILKGQPVPNDPIYGKPYRWDPQTRQLMMPAGSEFSHYQSRPLTLPKPSASR